MLASMCPCLGEISLSNTFPNIDTLRMVVVADFHVSKFGRKYYYMMFSKHRHSEDSNLMFVIADVTSDSSPIFDTRVEVWEKHYYKNLLPNIDTLAPGECFRC